MPLAKTIYIAYIAPTLSQLSKTTLEPLEKFQSKVMWYILGCPTSTRIVNMLTELNLPLVKERIHANISSFGVKCLHSPHLAPHYSHVLRASLDSAAPHPPLCPGVRILANTVCSTLQRFDLRVPEAEVNHGPPPWRIPQPQVTFTPTSKADPPLLQKQLALEHIRAMSSSVPAARHLYVDGSVQPDGSAGCAMYSPDVEPPEEGWSGRRLPNSSSSIYCELRGLLLAVAFICERQLHDVILCDSQSALQVSTTHTPLPISSSFASISLSSGQFSQGTVRVDFVPCWHCSQQQSESPPKGRLPTPSARRRHTLPPLLQKDDTRSSSSLHTPPHGS